MRASAVSVAVGLVLAAAFCGGSAAQCYNYQDQGQSHCMQAVCFAMEKWGASKGKNFADMQEYMASPKGGSQCPKGEATLVKDWKDCGMMKGYPQCANAVAYAMQTARFG